MPIRILPIALVFALAACGGDETPAPEPTTTLDVPPAPPAADASPEAAPPAVEPSPAAPTAAPTLGTLAAIPDDWRGRWAGQGGSCADSSERRLDVEDERLIFYESVAVPQRIDRESERELVLQLSFTGEGEQWSRTTTLVLDDSGRTMRRSEDGSPIVTYTRCPSAE